MIKKSYELEPMPNRIIIQWDRAAGQVGRIIVPDKHKRRPQTGIIFSIGDKVNEELVLAIPLAIGDRILFAQFSGTEAGFSTPDKPNEVESYLILAPSEVLARLKGNAELKELSASA